MSMANTPLVRRRISFSKYHSRNFIWPRASLFQGTSTLARTLSQWYEGTSSSLLMSNQGDWQNTQKAVFLRLRPVDRGLWAKGRPTSREWRRLVLHWRRQRSCTSQRKSDCQGWPGCGAWLLILTLILLFDQDQISWRAWRFNNADRAYLNSSSALRSTGSLPWTKQSCLFSWATQTQSQAHLVTEVCPSTKSFGFFSSAWGANWWLRSRNGYLWGEAFFSSSPFSLSRQNRQETNP